ncbi:uncharacterized protein VP01_4428g1 [Puccinia sorghi]|uniref:DUF8040 domain-containing protein n=1 Tax=Puccinia sorghi TaxID=27349 RepID=A0A0L6UPI5_9BASI|nr:uncharacterized protein VP01_4428g1 [Puccinia sorghi]
MVAVILMTFLLQVVVQTHLTFKFLCADLIQVKMEPVSNLLSMEEQLAIFLYETGHNNSNRLAQDRCNSSLFLKILSHTLHLIMCMFISHQTQNFHLFSITAQELLMGSTSLLQCPPIKLLNLVISRIPPGKFYLADAGYGLNWGVVRVTCTRGQFLALPGKCRKSCFF